MRHLHLWRLIQNWRRRRIEHRAERLLVCLRDDQEILDLLREKLGNIWYYQQAVRFEIDGYFITRRCCGFPMAKVRGYYRNDDRKWQLANLYNFAVCLDKRCKHAEIAYTPD